MLSHRLRLPPSIFFFFYIYSYLIFIYMFTTDIFLFIVFSFILSSERILHEPVSSVFHYLLLLLLHYIFISSFSVSIYPPFRSGICGTTPRHSSTPPRRLHIRRSLRCRYTVSFRPAAMSSRLIIRRYSYAFRLKDTCVSVQLRKIEKESMRQKHERGGTCRYSPHGCKKKSAEKSLPE